ncbi:sarcosine oxidase subunit beta [Dethiosulfatarculus sandiegensis]|uniref:Sarcosine oxidase subunit beta n=1 Tax=Dethiosulfatarculus sandiegensis TaxID=1429043 RepID=A0A0D2JNU9_9BACT|nr:sarcosine oxidase subunit beta [Dethiosulfatarculus sandiegensis]
MVIGGGLHGLATAYFLAKDHKMRRIAVLERKHFGYGGSSRNTEVFRVNQRAPEILPLYVLSKNLWLELSAELEWNLMVWEKGLVGLAHSEAGFNNMLMRHETQRRMGIENYLLNPEELKKLVPLLDISQRRDQPVVGGYFNPPGGQVHHDAAVWGFVKACHRMGVDLCPKTEVTGIQVKNGRVTGVETPKGEISSPLVLMAPGGYSSTVAEKAGLELPVVTLPLQAMVTECVRPCLDHVMVSESYFCYVQQTVKGDLIMGAHLDPWQSYKLYNTYEFAREQAYGMLEMMPDIANLKIMRTWSGLCDMTVDGAPVMGATDIENLFVDAGWGYFGFKSSPGCGKTMAEYMATGNCPETIRYLGIDRFYEGRMIPESYIART